MLSGESDNISGQSAFVFLCVSDLILGPACSS